MLFGWGFGLCSQLGGVTGGTVQWMRPQCSDIRRVTAVPQSWVGLTVGFLIGRLLVRSLATLGGREGPRAVACGWEGLGLLFALLSAGASGCAVQLGRV